MPPLRTINDETIVQSSRLRFKHGFLNANAARYTVCMRHLAAIAGFGVIMAATVSTDYVREIESWRQERAARLKSDTGWLTVAGLFWLREGPNTAGTAADNAIVLPAGAAPAHIGVFDLHDPTVTFRAQPGVAVQIDGRAAARAELKPDTSEKPDAVSVNDLTMFVIERAGQFGIRLRYKNSPFRRNFTGLKWYPVRPEYRMEAKFLSEPKKIRILNILGQTDEEDSPGSVEFTFQGKPYRMVALTEDNTLFFVFRDRTSSHATYGAGRMLNTPMPRDGKVDLDFNKAYNPPCAYIPYATCPLPPAENRLPFAIEAGEMNYGDHH